MNNSNSRYVQTQYTDFNPPRYLRNPDVQTFFGSSKLRLWRTGSIETKARDIVITTDTGVRLTGAFSKTAQSPAKGLVILLHGWEGSKASTYVMTSGQYLLDRSFDLDDKDDIVSLIENDHDNRVVDFHAWKIDARHRILVVSLVTHYPQKPDYYKELILQKHHFSLIHVEVHVCEEYPCLTV